LLTEKKFCSLKKKSLICQKIIFEICLKRNRCSVAFTCVFIAVPVGCAISASVVTIAVAAVAVSVVAAVVAVIFATFASVLLLETSG
jgi:hypothetical protein